MTTALITADAFRPPLEPARVSRWLLWAVAALTFASLLWAAVARLDETASAPGRVVPAAELQVVSNLEGGTVEAVLVKPGARVAAGQPLLRLDASQNSADYGRSSSLVAALAARAARLEGEATGRAPAFPAGLPAAVVATEAALHAARRDEAAAAASVESAKLAQAERALGEAQADAGARGQAATLAAQEAAALAPLVNMGIEPRMALTRADSARAQAQGAAAAAAMAVARARSAVAEARSGLRGVAERFRSQAAEQLAQTRADLAAQSAAVPAAAGRLSRSVVRAPVAGTVSRVLITTIGGSVRPGEPLVEIVPAGGGLVVEAQVRPSDIAFIHPGQRASVKLTAYDYSVYGALPGTVERISADAIGDPRGGEAHYAVRVLTTGTLRGQDGRALQVASGMVAEVDVLGRKRSVLSYLLSPVTKLSEDAFREK